MVVLPSPESARSRPTGNRSPGPETKRGRTSLAVRRHTVIALRKEREEGPELNARSSVSVALSESAGHDSDHRAVEVSRDLFKIMHGSTARGCATTHAAGKKKLRPFVGSFFTRKF